MTPYSEYYDYPPYQGVPKLKICLFFIPRSASNYLAGLMDEAGLGFPLEYFSHSKFKADWIQRRTTKDGIFSFKWNSNFGYIPQLLKPDVSLFIDRRDRVAQAKSFYLAEKNGDFMRPYGHIRMEGEFLFEQQKLDLMRVRTVAMMPDDALVLYTEDVVKDPDGTIEKIRKVVKC